MNDSQESPAYSALKEMFQGGRPLIFVCTPEEGRVRQLLQEVADTLFAGQMPVWSWSLTSGLRHPDGRPAEKLSPQAVLEFIAEHRERGIFQLKDFHPFVCDDPAIRRRLRDLYELCLDSGKFLVITSPLRVIPEELSRQIALVELQTPDFGELAGFLRRETEAIASQDSIVDRSEPTLFAMARALQGLTLDEARHALRRALAVNGSLDANSLPCLVDEKKLIVNRTGLIQYIADATQLEHVGGLEYLKAWLVERRKLFLERDSLSAEIVPKGVLVMGVSGCGKSLSVKAIASCFGLPLYRIEMSEVFSGRHGNPDAAFVQACRTVESVAPAVVWFDEIEMGLDDAKQRKRHEPRAHLRFFPDLDAGEDARTVCRGHRQPHRPASGGDDPQRPFRRSVFHRPSHGRGTAGGLPDSPAKNAESTRKTCSSTG